VLRAAILLSLLSLPALAADPEVGSAGFASACARCHAATQVKAGENTPRIDRKNARPGAGPDLTEALLQKGYDPVRTWIESPVKVRKDTACDTRQLPPAQIDDLLAYLMSQVVPEQPNRKERLANALAEDKAHAIQAGVPTDRVRRKGKKQ
jgi:mono/diheme cytochrome c family protein